MRISDCSSDVCSSDLRRYADHRSGRDDSCRERRGPVPFGADGRTVSVGPLIFVIVGEPSGDAIGARLMTALKRATGDRKSVVWGKGVYVRVDLSVRGSIKNQMKDVRQSVPQNI